jgi:hypothetical protein
MRHVSVREEIAGGSLANRCVPCNLFLMWMDLVHMCFDRSLLGSNRGAEIYVSYEMCV